MGRATFRWLLLTATAGSIGVKSMPWDVAYRSMSGDQYRRCPAGVQV